MTTHTDQDELEAAGLYARSFGSRPARRSPEWVLALESRERRLWILAVVAAVVLGATAVGLVYADDYNKQSTIRSLQTSNESLTGHSLILQDQLKATQANLTATLGELAQTKAQLEHPTLVTWKNSAQQLKDNTMYLASGVPDTFTLHLQLTSTGPMDVSIVTIEGFAAGVECTHNGVGPTDYCMHRQQGIDISWLGVTSINYDFHKAEGCADYIVVITAPRPVTVTPNVSVTYNPASAPTGTCA